MLVINKRFEGRHWHFLFFVCVAKKGLEVFSCLGSKYLPLDDMVTKSCSVKGRRGILGAMMYFLQGEAK